MPELGLRLRPSAISSLGSGSNRPDARRSAGQRLTDPADDPACATGPTVAPGPCRVEVLGGVVPLLVRARLTCQSLLTRPHRNEQVRVIAPCHEVTSWVDHCPEYGGSQVPRARIAKEATYQPAVTHMREVGVPTSCRRQRRSACDRTLPQA